MRIGILAFTSARVAAMAVATIALWPANTEAQLQRQSNGAVQALYTTPSGAQSGEAPSSYTDHFGNPLIVPAGFQQSACGCGGCGGYGDCSGYGGGGCYGGCNGGCSGHGGSGCGGGFNTCMPMGCGGTDPPIGYDLMNDVGIEGDLADQRGPHYFDVRAEAVYLHRDDTFEDNIDFTSLNVGNTVVLSSRQLEFDEQTGFRVIGRYDICPLAVVEFGYTGIFNWETSASFNDPTGNLFSLFSRPAPETGLFGTSPAGVNLPGGPNPESERALSQSISLDSDLQSAEISYRRYWLGYSPRISGTLLAGFRYTRLNEDFEFFSQGSEPATNFPLGPLASLEYDLKADNNLAGFQLGGDAWISLFQGFRVGSEAKAGLYNNHYVLTNRITTNPPGTTPPSLFERFRENQPAFLAEGSVDAVADILPSLSIRAGYEALFINSLVLAGDNFNQTSPYGNQGVREPFVHDQSQVFYHGAHLGIEYIW